MMNDGMTVVVGAAFNDDDVCDSDHVNAHVYSSTTNKWNQLG